MNFRLFTSLIVFVVSFIFLDSGPLLAPIYTVLWHYFVNYYMLDKPLKKEKKS